jgi:predicted enzyme related to lactoylglutathione lyase
MNMLVNIDVDDLHKAVTFYVEALDLRVGRQLGNEIVEMVGAPVPIHLLAKPAGSKAASQPGSMRTYERHWTPVHLDFVVQDIDSAVERALKAGATLERSPQLNKWGKLALMADPFGNGFCLVQFLGKGYDEIATPSY